MEVRLGDLRKLGQEFRAYKIKQSKLKEKPPEGKSEDKSLPKGEKKEPPADPP